jgi:hypothetical protein
MDSILSTPSRFGPTDDIVQEIFEIPNDSTEPTGNDVILNILFYK